MQKFKNIVLCVVCFAMIALFLAVPQAVGIGAFKGLTICAEIIVPSLYIFAVVGIFLVSSNCLNTLASFITTLSRLLFGLDGKLFTVFLVSLFAGYPIGSKMLDKLVEDGSIDENCANTMLCYCVNAGPAFVVLAIGEKIFLSRTIGLFLLFSHIFSSLFIALILRNKTIGISSNEIKKEINYADVFVTSVADAAQSIINICAFVILFTSIDEVLKLIGLQAIVPFLEVTTGIISTKNIFFAAFLLGFSGISIQLQILSLIKNFKVKKIRFLLFRVLHGAISVIFMHILIKISKISLHVISNDQTFYFSPTALSLGTSLCFIFTAIVLISALKTKKTPVQKH